MDITMDDSRITNVTQIREFLKGSIVDYKVKMYMEIK